MRCTFRPPDVILQEGYIITYAVFCLETLNLNPIMKKYQTNPKCRTFISNRGAWTFIFKNANVRAYNQYLRQGRNIMSSGPTWNE
jgi:hypothetical protein